MKDKVKQNREFLVGVRAKFKDFNTHEKESDYIFLENNFGLLSNQDPKKVVRAKLAQEGYDVLIDSNTKRHIIKNKISEEFKEIFKNNTINQLLRNDETLNKYWGELFGLENDNYYDKYYKMLDKIIKKKALKDEVDLFNTINTCIMDYLVREKFFDIRLFGSAFEINKSGVSHAKTGPVQVSTGTPFNYYRGYSYSEDSEACYVNYIFNGSLSKFNAEEIGMSQNDFNTFRKFLIEGLFEYPENDKEDLWPIFYYEILFDKDYSSFIGNLPDFYKFNGDRYLKTFSDIDRKVDISKLNEIIKDVKSHKVIDKTNGWYNNELEYDASVFLPDGCELIDPF